MYSEKLAFYYDSIYSGKNYAKEADFIKSLTSEKKIKKVLDVGCGTGKHLSHLLNDTVEKMIGVDLSYYMIEEANKKNNSNKISFLNKGVADIKQKDFDLVISMFNVINHIETIQELQIFFSNIRSKMKKGATFIFDVWNGVAAIRSLPKKDTRIKESDPISKIVLKCEPEVDLMNTIVRMKNSAEVFYIDELVDSFSYELIHVLWTPKVLSDLLNDNNFRVRQIFKSDSLSKATCEDYKILFMSEAI